MRRWLIIVAWILGAQASAHKPPAIQILNDRGFVTSDYSKLSLTAVTASDFQANLQGDSTKEMLSSQVEELNRRTTAQLDNYCQVDFQGGKGQGILGMTLVLSSFTPGAASAKAWTSFGPDAGRCQYEVQLRDEKDVEVADFMIRSPIQSWMDVSGEASQARAPKILLEEIRGFFSSH